MGARAVAAFAPSSCACDDTCSLRAIGVAAPRRRRGEARLSGRPGQRLRVHRRPRCAFAGAAGRRPPPLAIVAIAHDGRETAARRTQRSSSPRALRAGVRDARRRPPFYLLPALSGIAVGGALELDTRIRRVRVADDAHRHARADPLPAHDARAPRGDYAFDPDWDIERRCGERRIADDSLDAVLAHSTAKRLPVLVTLNGGIWADASCDVARVGRQRQARGGPGELPVEREATR